MGLDIKTGWEKHGVSAGKRDFREPKKLPEFDLMNLLIIFVFSILAIQYAIYLKIRELLVRHIWAEPLSLKGKVCLVTGSGRGLGRQICLDLARRGAVLACADINEETNRVTMKLLQEMGATAKAYKLNVANRKDVLDCVDAVEKELGPVFVGVNNAAILLPQSECSEEFIRASFNVNTLGPIWVTQALLPKMEANNSGNIVNIASITAYFPVPESDIYSATKAALRSYNHSVNMRLKKKGSNIKVICINPSIMNSSADYAEMLFHSRMKTVSVETVSNAIVEAIRYGIEDVTIPSFSKLILTFQSMPMKAVNLFNDLVSVNAIIPTMEEYQNLPAGDLVKACSSAGGTSESKENPRVFAG